MKKRRINEIKKILEKNDIEALLLITTDFIRDRNVDYILGTFLENVSASIIISLDEIKLLAPKWFEIKIDNSVKIIEIKNFFDVNTIKKEIKKFKKIGINKNYFPYTIGSKLRKFKLIDVSEELLNIRAIKDEEEIRNIKRACSISNKIIKKIEKEIRKNLSEFYIEKIIEEEIAKINHATLAFNTIIASDRRSGSIHPIPSYSNKKIKNYGIIDFGIRYKGYCSDVTIPFLIGDVPNKLKKILRVIKNIHDSSIEQIKPFLEVKYLFESANENVKNTFGFEMQHALGHGIGLDIHEYPTISPKSKNIFKDNMIFTIEPGIYIKNAGFRIENDLLIKNKKPKLLTKANIIEK